jgi:hypothetical protein
MDKKELTLLSGIIVTESELSKSAKLQLLNWLQKEASEAQIKAFLLDGKITKLDEQAEEIVNERFELNKLNEGLLKTVFGMFLLSPPGWVAYRAIRGAFSKASRKCGVFSSGRARDMCLIRAKMTKYNKLINLIKRQMKNCSKSKNPEKCKEKGQAKIEKWTEDLRELQGRIEDLKKRATISVTTQSEK